MSRHNPKLLCSDAGQESRSVLTGFEAHLSEVTFGTCLPLKTERSVPVEQGKIVPRYLLTKVRKVISYIITLLNKRCDDGGSTAKNSLRSLDIREFQYLDL